MRLVWGIVTSVEHSSGDIQRVEVALDDRSVGPAIVFPSVTGSCGVAERVLVNVTASSVDAQAGVRAVVVARANPSSGVAFESRSGGRTLKMRYTPLQNLVPAVEEKEGPHFDAVRSESDISSMPVACCALPGQVFPAAFSAKSVTKDLKVAYVMTDEGALTLSLSDAVRAARAAGLVDVTITCGQSFGGDLEAVNLHSGLIAAKHAAKADVAVVAPGPGVPSTATVFGHGGVGQGTAINAVAALRGVPVAVPRFLASQNGDPQGLHPQTVVALTAVSLAPAVVPVPPLPSRLAEEIAGAFEAAGIWRKHKRVDVPELPASAAMAVRNPGGRSEDATSASAAAAVGVLCARYATGELLPPLRDL